MSDRLKAVALKKGDSIGIITPASMVASAELVAKIIKYIEESGFRPVVGEFVWPVSGIPSDQVKKAELESFWLDEEIKALWCLRGGYGTIRLLPLLNYRLLGQQAKILIGFSDITALELGLWQKNRLVSYHGPVLTHFDRPFSMENAFSILLGNNSPNYIWPDHEWGISNLLTIRPGKAQGHFLGGNIATLCSLIGTEYWPDFHQALLFLEEVEEESNRLDRLLVQLKLNRVFHNVAAVMVGRCRPVAGETEADLQKVFVNNLKDLACPVAYGFPIGHIEQQWTLLQGGFGEVDTVSGECRLLEAPVL